MTQTTPENTKTIEALESAARDLWDDRWTIEVQYFADGDSRAHAYSNRGETEDGNKRQKRLLPDEGQTLHLEEVILDRHGEPIERRTLESRRPEDPERD